MNFKIWYRNNDMHCSRDARLRSLIAELGKNQPQDGVAQKSGKRILGNLHHASITNHQCLSRGG